MVLVREMRFKQKKRISKEVKEKVAKLIEDAQKEDSKIVKGVFKNLETPGGDITFVYKVYKNEPTRLYTLTDGEQCELPLGVAKHINRQCKRKRSAYLVDKDGRPIIGAGKPKQRYEFISTEYM